MTLLFATTIALAVIGFVLFLGCLIALIATEGRSLTAEETEALVGRTNYPRAGWRRFRFRGRVLAGGSIEREESMTTLKSVLRRAGWWRDPHWSLYVGAILGAVLMIYGLVGFGTVLSLRNGVPIVALLCIGPLVYATVQTVRAWRRS